MTRRRFLETTAAAASVAMLPLGALAQTKAKFKRYNVMSAGGKKALASYAKGVAAMLKLPATDPRNWFRNAFTHLMDCPHGNWWFYVWHRGYLGFFEETIRSLSGDPTFAIPYWDWTTLPEIPASMFDGLLTPRDMAFEPYTGNLGRFTASVQPALKAHWDKLTPAQREQLKVRGYTEFDLLWNDVTGYSPTNKFGISGNMSYAITCAARYLTRDNPKLDKKTAYDVSPHMVGSGLLPKEFNDEKSAHSFTSSKTPSHNTKPSGSTMFSILEGFPHNKVHNYLGGVGPVDPGPYGNMTNFLSPVDPIFFLHHSNMDRLWDVWTRKQQALKLPWLPTGQDLDTLSKEPFLFYINSKGQPVGESKAGEYLSMDRFGYDYEPGFGEELVKPLAVMPLADKAAPLEGTVQNNTASVPIARASIQRHIDAKTTPSLLAKITLPRPDMTSAVTREFDIIVGAPDEVTEVDGDSPFFAGTIAFFGKMPSMEGMAMDATFTVPLPNAPQAFAQALAASPDKSMPANIKIRVVSSHHPHETPPTLKSVSVHAL
ncbi:MAG: tyrosinase family protein [Chthoniobacterales bacterium]